ncbi:MAG TPA: hypothetical protein VNQ76_01600 [Planctomicrobium sp.]|nr:hypothetical protein [Planctomicrobium sp.]
MPSLHSFSSRSPLLRPSNWIAGVVVGACLCGTFSSIRAGELLVPPLPENPAPQAAIEIPPLMDALPAVEALPILEKLPASPVKQTPSNSRVVNFEEENWSMTITPGPTPHPEEAKYRAAYESVPYRRSEYLANPGYRHEAAMDKLFGERRSMVVQRTDHAERVVNPRPAMTQPYPLSQAELYRYQSVPFYRGFLPVLPAIP